MREPYVPLYLHISLPEIPSLWLCQAQHLLTVLVETSSTNAVGVRSLSLNNISRYQR